MRGLRGTVVYPSSARRVSVVYFSVVCLSCVRRVLVGRLYVCPTVCPSVCLSLRPLPVCSSTSVCACPSLAVWACVCVSGQSAWLSCARRVSAVCLSAVCLSYVRRVLSCVGRSGCLLVHLLVCISVRPVLECCPTWV